MGEADGTGGAVVELEALRRQDPAAFTRLVEAHQRIVLGLGQSMGLRGADLDDAAAEAFAGVYRSLPKFEGRSALSTWVYQIAARSFWKWRQRRDQRRSAEAADEAIGDRVDEEQISPDDAAGASEEQKIIWDAVGNLDPRQATAVELHYRRGFPIEEVAQQMGCPEGTIKTLLFRAREQLRNRLARKLGRVKSEDD